MRTSILAIIAAALLGWTSGALACHSNCTVEGNNYACDIHCDPVSGCAVPASHAACDAACPDGKCTICGTAQPETLTGTSGADVICGASGDDTIDAGAGNDLINGNGGDDTIYADNDSDRVFGEGGHDVIFAGDPAAFALAGDDYVDGGSGDDEIHGSNKLFYFGFPIQGDNILLGGTGDDSIIAGTGRDVLKGGDGDDDLSTGFTAAGVTNDVVGSIFCGGDDDDIIDAVGPSHQCIDGGEGTDACTYTYGPASVTANGDDIGTIRLCESGTTPVRVVGCGCD